MNATAEKVVGFYPKREAMPSNYRQLAMEATADDPNHRPPTEAELGDVVHYEQLTEEGRLHLAALMSYENEAVIIRFVEDQELDLETARRIFHGLKQYLAVCIFTGGKRTPAKIVDECWHTFLLHSRDYADFCEKFTRGFVHHEPAIDDSGFSFYPMTRRCVLALFGKIDDEVWPPEHLHYARCISTKDAEIARFNDYIE
jgi:hypothetical protein